MHDSLLLSWRRVSVFKCYWAVEGEELRHALVKAYNTWSFGLMLKVNWPEMSFSAPLWYFEGSWWKDTLPLTLLMPWEVAQFAWHFYFKGFFLLSPKCSCNELFFRWKKKKITCFFSNHWPCRIQPYCSWALWGYQTCGQGDNIFWRAGLLPSPSRKWHTWRGANTGKGRKL